MQTIYALIWRTPDETFSQAEFDGRVPRLMQWLRTLYKSGNLVACGGGGFEHHAGGLTLVRADSVEQALELSKGSPMNEIGETEVFVWDVFYAELAEVSDRDKLEV